MPTMIHDEHAVADLLDLFHVMAGVYHGGAFGVQPLNAFEDGVAALRVDGHRWLVEEDEVGFMRNAAGDV